MASRTPYFYKVFIPSMHAQIMGIPPAFLKHMVGGTRRMVSLAGPSGKKWHVELVDKGSGMFFQKGWREFVVDHSIAAGDFLFFRYDGGSKFKVFVFGPNACEKEGLFDAIQFEDTNEVVLETMFPVNVRKNQRQDTAELVSEPVHPIMVRKNQCQDNTPLVSEPVYPIDVKKTPKCEDTTPLVSEPVYPSNARKNQCQDTAVLGSEPVYPINVRKNQDEETPITFKRKRGRPRKNVGNEEGHISPRRQTSTKEVCESLLKKSPSSTMVMPNKTQSQTQSLALKNPASNPSVERARSSLHDGALVPKFKSAVAERKIDMAQPEIGLDDGTDNDKDNDDDWTPTGIMTRDCGKKDARLQPKKLHSDHLDLVEFKNEDMSGIKHVGPLKSQRRPVTADEVNRALKMSKTFKSKHPFTTIVMRESYCYCYFHLNIPFSFAKKHLPTVNGRMTLWDPQGRAWSVTYLYYNRRAGLKSGWSKFSLANNLEKDDVCIFEVIGSFQMRVHIYRVVEELTALVPEPLAAKNEHISHRYPCFG